MTSGDILLVDDDADIREVMALVLESYGYRVIGASDGEQALRVMRDQPAVTLVLLDLMMPIMDGPSFMKNIKADATLPLVSVVVLSGDSAACQTAEAMGADACLLKPVDLTCLLDTVHRFVRRLSSTGAPTRAC